MSASTRPACLNCSLNCSLNSSPNRTLIRLQRRHPNVHLDLSGIPPKKLLEALPRAADIAHKLLWGTDWPSMGVSSMRKNVDDFLALPLPDDAKRRILYDNAAALFPSS